MKKFFTVITSVALVLSLSACDEKKGPVEKMGERADEIVDNVHDGDPILHRKGPVEKVGESIDDTVKDMTGEKH